MLRTVSASSGVSQTGYSGWACQSASDRAQLHCPPSDLQCGNYSKPADAGACGAWPGKSAGRQWGGWGGRVRILRRQRPGSACFSAGHY